MGPESFIREARALRVAVLRHPPGHVQRTAAYFLSLGHYDALVHRMKQTFRRRRQVMDEAIRAQGLEVAAAGGFGGSSFWMRAPEGVDTEDAGGAVCASEGVLIEPGRAFFDPEGRPGQLLSAGLFLDPGGADRRGDRHTGAGDGVRGRSPGACPRTPVVPVSEETLCRRAAGYWAASSSFTTSCLGRQV